MMQYINTGSSPNSGDGDSLRSAFTKININFKELSTLSNTVLEYADSLISSSTVFTTSTLKKGLFTTELDGNGNLNVSGHLLPTATNVFNLGSDVKRWNTVYVNALTLREAIITGDLDSDNYSRIRHLENVPLTGGVYKAYGFTAGNEQSTVIVNEDANVNQVLFLGDSGPTDDETLFGVGLSVNFDPNMYQNPSTGLESTWEKRLELTGEGQLYLHNGTIHTANDYIDLGNFYVNITTATGLSIDGISIFSNVKQHILPAADLTYDLGSTSSQWRSLYVGTGTIYIGGIPITVNTSNNTLIVGSTESTTATNLATESFVIDYVSQNSGGGGVGSTLVNGTATLSISTLSETVLPSGLTFTPIENYGFGFGGTIAMQTYGEVLQMLATGTNAYGLFGWGETIGAPGGVAYLVGNQDGTNEVKIVAGSYTATVNTWKFDQNGSVILPAGNGNIKNTSGDVNIVADGFAQLQWTTPTGVAEADPNGTTQAKNWIYVESGGAYIETNISTSTNSRVWYFDNDGKLNLPGGGYAREVDDIYSPNSIVIRGRGGQDGVRLQWSNTVTNFGDIPIGESVFEEVILSDTGITLSVLVTDGNNPIPVTWDFKNTGVLTLPNGGTLGPEGMGWAGFSNGITESPVSIVNKKANGDWFSAITLNNDGNSGTITLSVWNTTTVTYKELTFNNDGSLTFPTMTVPISDNTNPSGTGQTLKFNDPSQQAIIYGPPSDASYNSAQRVIIQGAPGYDGTIGEGGDIYLWAGPGGSAGGDGGDIKIRAGRGLDTGSGGYLNFQAGNAGVGVGANGGWINIESGQSALGVGGDITIHANSSGNIDIETVSTGVIRLNTAGGTRVWTFSDTGNLSVPGGIYNNEPSNVGQLLLSGDIGEAATYLALPSDVGSTSMNVRLANSNGTVQIIADNNKYWYFNGTGGLELPGGSVLATSGYDVALAAGNDGNSTFGSVTIFTQGPPTVYTVIQQTSPFSPDTITTDIGSTPNIASIVAGMTVTGNGITATTTVTNVTGPDGYGTYFITISPASDTGLYYNDTFTFTSAGGITNRNWEFNSLGELYLPQGSAIQETAITNELWGTTTTSLTLVPGGAANGTQRLEIYSTGGGEGNHIHITSGDQSQTDLFLGNDTQYFAVAASGANYIQARTGAASTGSGVSAGPGANVNIYAGNAGDNGGNVADGNSGGDVFISSGISSSGLGGDILINTSSGPDGFGSIELSTNGGSSTWTFNKDNQLVFPDGTIQTTAYPGYLTWSISANGSSSYVFSGPGIETGNTENPILYLYKGFTYKFVNTTGGSHPFAIRVSNGGADYTSGVLGSQTGTQTFTVPMNAPSTLYYQCTFHSGMGNVINIV